MNAILSLAALAASVSAGVSINAMDLGLAVSRDFSSVREQVCESLPDGESFAGTGVERILEIDDMMTGGAFCLVDFDGRNGYVMFGSDLSIIGLSLSGDFNYESIVFGFDSKFLSFGDGYHPFSKSVWGAAHSPKGRMAFSGPLSLSSYIEGKYGTGYDNFEMTAWPGWSYRENSEFSIYKENVGGYSYKDEDNCLLSSIFKSLEMANGRYSSYGYSSIPMGEVVAGGESDPFFSSLMAAKTASGEQRYVIAKSEAPESYRDIRDYFIINDGYRTGPSTVSKGVGCISNLASRYGTAMSASFLTDWSFTGEIVDNANKQSRVGYIWTPSGGDYANHSMNAIGFTYFKKESGWWIFKRTDYVYFSIVDDGRSGKMSAVDFTELEKNSQKGTIIKIIF